MAPRNFDPATMAAIANGWIDDQVPEVIAAGLADMVEQWGARGDLPLGALWRRIVDTLHTYGCFDGEIDACRLVLSLQPNQPFFQLRLIEMLRRSGRGDEARQVLAETRGSDRDRSAALLEILKLEGEPPAARMALFDALELLLLADGEWSDRHLGLIAQLVEAGLIERASTFFGQWTERWTVKSSHLADMGVVAMQLGKPHLARSFFAPIWAYLSNGPDPTIPHFDGSISPYDDTIEAALVERIEAAFALDEAALPCLPPPDHGAPPPGTRVMMLTFGHNTLPNDLAEHFGCTAAEAGLDFQLYLDRALTMPGDFQGGDDEVARRVERFADALARVRPDVLIIDCVAHYILRGLNPAAVAELRARFGFRLVCVMRDAHDYIVDDLDKWLRVCDAMVIFDPLSPVLSPERAPLNRKVVVLPVPSWHALFLERGERDLGLTFVGSAKRLWRYMPLSVLMTEDIRFTAVFGPRRAVEVPDTRSYARLLARSRGVLNVSCHGYGVHLITGRVWEAVAAGSLLVEQDNPATAMVFAPYRHYLPWTTVEDIVQIARFIDRRPDLAARIADEAHAWARRYYNGDRFWAALLGHASDQSSGRSRGAER